MNTYIHTLVIDETPPDAIDETARFREAHDKWVCRLVES